MDSWDVIDCTDDMNVLASIWAFKIKWCTEGLIKKLKTFFKAKTLQELGLVRLNLE
mgnify:CR=1 FL=1